MNCNEYSLFKESYLLTFLKNDLNEQRGAKEPADLRPPFGVPPLGLNKSRLTR